MGGARRPTPSRPRTAISGAPGRAVRRLLVLRSTSGDARDGERRNCRVRSRVPRHGLGRRVAALIGSTGTIDADTVVWVDVRGDASRLLDGPPRGVAVGR